MAYEFERTQRIAVLGGGPGGYEAALAGAQLGADVTLVEREGVGGSAVLTDVVPSKTLIATAEATNAIGEAADLGVQFFTRNEAGRAIRPEVTVNLAAVNARLLRLARQQCEDMKSQLIKAGVRIIHGEGRLDGPQRLIVSTGHGKAAKDFDEVEADTLVVSVGARPRILASAKPDGKRILTWTQLYELDETPEHLIVVGSGVTGAEFATAYTALGSKVTLISSRDQVLPGEDADAARVIEDVFKRNGMTVLSKSRADSVKATRTGVIATLSDGRVVEGSHCLMAVGSVPNTEKIGLEKAGVQLTESGHIRVNRVARTSMPSIYAAGDCSDFLPLASVASMQGRTAVFHAMGDAVSPDGAAQRDIQHLHPARDRDRRLVAEADRGRPRPGRHLQAAARIEPARQDDGHQGRLREDLRAHRLRHGDRRRHRRPARVRAHALGRDRGRAPPHRRPARAGVLGVPVAHRQHHGCGAGDAHRELSVWRGASVRDRHQHVARRDGRADRRVEAARPCRPCAR